MRSNSRIGIWAVLFVAAIASAWSAAARADGGQGDRAVPKAADVARAESAIKDIFKDEFEQATSNEQKISLASSLLAQGVKTESDAVEKYALLQTAMNLAAAAGDLGLAFEAITATSATFKVEALKLKADLLVKLLKAPADETARKTQLEQALSLVEPTLLAGDYASAKKLAAAGLLAVRSTDNTEQLREFTLLAKEADDSERARVRATAALKSLEKQPTGKSANLEVGRFRCLFEGNFAAGLPMLVLGSDQKFSAAAQQELADPKDATEQLKLADEWWDLSQREKGIVKKNLEKHALDWYRLASAGLDGILKAKVDKRIADALGVYPERPRPNVAGKQPTPAKAGAGAASTGNLATALSRLRPVCSDDFSDPESGFHPLTNAEFDLRYKGGWLCLEALTNRGMHIAVPAPWVLDSAVIRLTARSSSPENPGWGFVLSNPDRKQSMSILVHFPSKSLVLNAGLGSPFVGPAWREIPAPSLKLAGEANVLLVMVKGQYVELYLNGEAVGEPFVIEQNVWPARCFVRLDSKKQGTVAYDEITIWPADNLPVKRPDLVR